MWAAEAKTDEGGADDLLRQRREDAEADNLSVAISLPLCLCLRRVSVRVCLRHDRRRFPFRFVPRFVFSMALALQFRRILLTVSSSAALHLSVCLRCVSLLCQTRL